jgi:phospholipid-binding lipoprotein MlaA
MNHAKGDHFMNRTPYIIMLFALFLLNPIRAFATSPSMEPHALPTHEKEGTLATDPDSIQNEESLFGIAEQKGQDREEPVKERSSEQNDLTEESAAEEEETPGVADPLRPWNNAMYHFNDKFYFWALKPVTQAYKLIVPEPFRIMFNNFFDNLRAPGRFVNKLLQLKMKEAGNELIRFAFNSIAGVGGLADASKDVLGIQKTPVDFGQTLGHYRIDHGFYLVWPILGPSSLRDTIGFIGDQALYPLSYISFANIPFEVAAGTAGFETVNKTSFQIGDYEAFKEAAIDPYVSLRDAYVQNRKGAAGK